MYGDKGIQYYEIKVQHFLISMRVRYGYQGCNAIELNYGLDPKGTINKIDQHIGIRRVNINHKIFFYNR